MPQMAPMSWMTLFMFFTLSLFVMMTINYYIFIPMINSKGSPITKKTNSMNWKW